MRPVCVVGWTGVRRSDAAERLALAEAASARRNRLVEELSQARAAINSSSLDKAEVSAPQFATVGDIFEEVEGGLRHIESRVRSLWERGAREPIEDLVIR